MTKSINHINYKKKALLAISLFAIMLIISYLLAIKNTFEVYSQYKSIEEKIQPTESLLNQIKNLENKLSYAIDSEKFTFNKSKQELILKKITDYTKEKQVALVDFPQHHTFTNDNFKISTYYPTLKGSYIDLLKFLFDIETSAIYGKISGVEFNSKYNYKTKKTSLLMTLYIQNIERNE